MFSLKTKKKKKKSKKVNALKIALQSKRQWINIEKEKEKRTMRKSQTAVINIFFLLLCFVKKHIWKNLVYIITFVLQFFYVVDYRKWSKKHQRPLVL